MSVDEQALNGAQRNPKSTSNGPSSGSFLERFVHHQPLLRLSRSVPVRALYYILEVSLCALLMVLWHIIEERPLPGVIEAHVVPFAPALARFAVTATTVLVPVVCALTSRLIIWGAGL